MNKKSHAEATILLFAMLLSIFLPVTTLSASANSTANGMLKTEDIFGGSFSPREKLVAPGEAFDVTFCLCPTKDALNAVISFVLPADLVKLVSGDQVWTGDLKKGEPLKLALSFVANGEIKASVRANVEGFASGEKYDSSYYLSVDSTGPKSAAGDNFASPSRQITVADTLISSAAESSRAKTLAQTNANASSSSGTITIEGTAYFINENGGWSPMRYVLVWLRDDDTFGDEWVAYTWTDANGFFSITADNDDGFLQDGRDPYIEVYAEGAWDWFSTTGGGDKYYVYTDKCGDDVPDGFYYNYGSFAPASYNEAWQAGDAVYAEMQWIFDRVGWYRSKVNIRWPVEDWPHSHGDTIDLPDKSVSGWWHVTAQHEDGHCVMWTLYGNTWPSTGHGGEMHSVMDEKDGGFAMIEGWAEFMQCAVDNDPTHLGGWYNGHGGNIETNDWFNCIDTGDMDGNIIEGSCASILWDILDPVNIAGDKDHMDWGYAPIFTVLQYDHPGDMLAFWDDWKARWPDVPTSVGPLCNIYWNYGIDEDWYAPWGSIVINAGASYTNSRTVTLTLSADDWGSGVRYMRFSEDYGSTWGPWYYYATTFSYTITSANDGWKWIDVQFGDYWGQGYTENRSPPGTIYDGIGLDTTPPTGTITINSGATYTNSRTVTLTLSGSDAYSGVYQMRFSENMGAWGSWVAYATTYSYTLTSAGDGYKTVDVQFKDHAGNPSTAWAIWDGITLDTIPPTGSIVINSGATYTTSRVVTLTLSASDATSGVYQMRFSENMGAWGSWVAYATTYSYNLTSAGDGYKTVDVQFSDHAGLTSTAWAIWDGITLDTAAPTGSIVIGSGNPTYTTTTAVTLYLTYSDATSGVSQVRYSNDGVWDTEPWEAPAATKAWTLTAGEGTKKVFYQIKDNAGLLSATYADTIILDTVAPTGSIIINSGNPPTTTTTAVTLYLTYSDATSGVYQVRYSNDGVWDTEPWEAPAATKAWTLTSGAGLKTVYYQIKDNAGLLSSTYSDTITLVGVSPAYLVVRGADSKIYYRTYSGGSWGSWNVLPGSTIDSPAAAVCNNELHVVVRGSDGITLYHGYVDLATSAFSGWTLLSGSTPSAPTLTSNGTVLSLVVRGSDNRIYYRVYTFSPRSWGSWSAVPTGSTQSSLAAAMLGNNLHIVVRGSDGTSLWNIVVKPGSGVVRNWILLSGSTPSTPVLAANQTANKLYLTVRGSDNKIYWRTYDGGADSWAGWNALPTGTTPDAPAATIADNKLQIVVRDMTGSALYHGNVDLGTSTFSGWTLLSGSTPSTPILTS